MPTPRTLSLRWSDVSTTTPRPAARKPRLLVVAGHPDPQSYSHALARAYAETARQAGAAVTVLDLATTDLDTAPVPYTHLRATETPQHLA